MKPYGIAVSRIGRVYVTDTVARRVFVFDPEAKTVSFLGETGTARLTKPVGVAVDRDDNVFVADATANRVFGYSLDGRLLIAIGREGEFDNPSGLAMDRTRNLLYVADAKKHQVLCYSTKDGSPVRTIGHRGGDRGEFNFPTNLFVDARGRLYVTDTMNFRIQVFDAEGAFISEFGAQGDTPGSFNRPKGVGVDSEGHIYVVDSSFNNFQTFDADGRLLLFVGSVGREPGEFFLPAGLFVDDRDRIYVADQGNARVQVFEYLKDVRLMFDPANPSFHPVEAAGVNTSVPSLVPGWTTASIVLCADCHDNDQGPRAPAPGTGPAGPHGSNFKHLLVARYDMDNSSNAESAAAYALCYKCHDRTNILANASFSEHRMHISSESASCSMCHDSHGISSTQGNAISNSNLMNFDKRFITPSSGGILRFDDLGARRGRCYLTCHGKNHNPISY